MPTNNTILCDDRADALAWPVGSFRLMLCHHCGFVFNADYDEQLVEHSSRTDETQAFSPHFVGFARSLAREWIERFGIRGQTVLEIGCGKAEFLSMMCDLGDNRGIGFDPAVEVDRVEDDVAARLTLTASLFGDQHLGVDANALVCRHTLEHIADVHRFLSMLRRWATRRRVAPIVLFEVPDVERVLREVAFWDLFYEHCSYFTVDSLRFAFVYAGFDVVDVRRVYDAQYLVLEARARATGPADSAPVGDGVRVFDQARRFVDRYRSIVSTCRANLQRLVDGGQTVVLWGGGSKAVSFFTHLGVGDLVAAVVDVNPNKQGKFLVGSGHQVVGPEALHRWPNLQLVVMNPVYLSEIARMVGDLRVEARISSVNDLLQVTSTRH
jgi:hypothetical protein